MLERVSDTEDVAWRENVKVKDFDNVASSLKVIVFVTSALCEATVIRWDLEGELEAREAVGAAEAETELE